MPLIKIILLNLLMFGLAHSQQKSALDTHVPEALKHYIQKMLCGGKGNCFADFENNKISIGFDSMTKLSDIKAGDPIKILWFRSKALKKKPSIGPSFLGGPRSPFSFTERELNSPVSSLVSSSMNPLRGMWFVPLFEKNKIINFAIIEKYDDWGAEWHCAGEMQIGRSTIAGLWQKVITRWPKSGGYNPVLIQIGEYSWILHVPEKDDYNLTFLLYHHDTSADSLNLMNDPSYSTLTKSKDLLLFLNTPDVWDRVY